MFGLKTKKRVAELEKQVEDLTILIKASNGDRLDKIEDEIQFIKDGYVMLDTLDDYAEQSDLDELDNRVDDIENDIDDQISDKVESYMRYDFETDDLEDSIRSSLNDDFKDNLMDDMKEDIKEDLSELIDKKLANLKNSDSQFEANVLLETMGKAFMTFVDSANALVEKYKLHQVNVSPEDKSE